MSKRRYWALGLIAALMLVATACAGQGEPEPDQQGEPGGVTTIKEGVLTVGSCLDYPPFESVEAGDEVGFDIDLAEEIGKRLGLTVEWVRADFDTIFTAVAGGQFDMVAAAVTATGELGEERGQVVDFSEFYYNSRQSLAVNTAKTPDITSAADLGQGDVVAVQKGTTGRAWAEENLEPNGVELKTFPNATDALRDLEAGNVVAVVNDEPSTAEILKELSGVEIVEAIDTNEKYAFAFAPESDLIPAVNDALADIIADGTYAEIFGRYFPDVEVPAEFQTS